MKHCKTVFSRTSDPHVVRTTIDTRNPHAAAKSLVDAIGAWQDQGHKTTRVALSMELPVNITWMCGKQLDGMTPRVRWGPHGGGAEVVYLEEAA